MEGLVRSRTFHWHVEAAIYARATIKSDGTIKQDRNRAYSTRDWTNGMITLCIIRNPDRSSASPPPAAPQSIGCN
jgi:hypothetical protein